MGGERLRLHDFQGATHLVRVRGRPGDHIFFNADILRSRAEVPRKPSELLHFECLAWEIFGECGALVHGFSLEPDRGTWVLQTMGSPLEAIMRRVCGEHSRYLHHHRGIPKGRPAFPARYEAKVISPAYLAHAVRRVHRSPMEAGLSTHYAFYPFSSDRNYRGEVPTFPLTTADVWRSLARRGHLGVRGYAKFMEQDETPYVCGLFKHGSPEDARIVGDRLYAAKVRSWAKQARAVPSSEQLVETVARILGKTSDDIRSPTHMGVLGRALVAWYATRTGAASLTEVGEWFSISGAALHAAIRRCRSDAASSALFNRPVEELFERSIPALDD